MDISVVIVSWKVKGLLRQCLRSIYDNTEGVDFEVIVVDNDSGDGTAEMVLKEFPEASLIASNRNLGFAKGNNLGLEQASGEILFLLNPDTELRGNVLGQLVGFMKRNPSVGIAGTRLINPDGSLQRSVRRLPTPWLALLWTLKIHRLAPHWRVFRHYLADDFDYSRNQPCQQVMGASMAIRDSLRQSIGPLDGRYFIWFEEVDYCKAALDAGWQVWYTPDATVIHYGGVSFGQVDGLTNQRRFNRSLRQYAWKHFGPSPWLILLLLHPISMLAAWLLAKRRNNR